MQVFDAWRGKLNAGQLGCAARFPNDYGAWRSCRSSAPRVRKTAWRMVWVSGHRRHGPANIAVARQGDLVDRGGCARADCACDWPLAVLSILGGMGRGGAGGSPHAIRPALPCHSSLLYFLACI